MKKILSISIILLIPFFIVGQTPVNDIVPEIIASGGEAQFTTTCGATEISNEKNLCNSPNINASVWYEYIPSENSKSVNVEFVKESIDGNIAIEFYYGIPGQMGNGEIEIAEEPFCINAMDYNFLLKCIDFTSFSIYVKVASSEQSCGNFRLIFSDNFASIGYETYTECKDAPALLVSSLNGVCSDTYLNNYDFCIESDDKNKGSSLWVKAEAADVPDNGSYVLTININTTSFAPILTIFIGNEVTSRNEYTNLKDNIVKIPLDGSIPVYIKVESLTDKGLGVFNLRTCASSLAYDCYSGSLSIIRPEYPDAPSTGPFKPGENIRVCADIDFVVDKAGEGNNCQWLQGVVPTFFEGIDIAKSDIKNQSLNPIGLWLEQDVVDYNISSPNLGLITLYDGSKGLAYGNLDKYLSPGDSLPSGLWFVSPGSGEQCDNDGDPDNMWGQPSGCGALTSNFECFNLKIKEIDLPETYNPVIDMNFVMFADGETGCWQEASCALSKPFMFKGNIDMSSTISLKEVNNMNKFENGVVKFGLVASNPKSRIILKSEENPYIMGETFEKIFPYGAAFFEDKLENYTQDTQTITYKFYVIEAEGYFMENQKILEFKIPPMMTLQIPSTPLCIGACADLNWNFNGNIGRLKKYLWSTGDTTLNITYCPKNEDILKFEATDSTGIKFIYNFDIPSNNPKKVEIVDDFSILSGKESSLVFNTEEKHFIEFTSFDNANIIGEIANAVFQDNSINLNQKLINTGLTDEEKVIYNVKSYNPETKCYSEDSELIISVFKFKVSETIKDACIDSCGNIVLSHNGQGPDVSYKWNTGHSGSQLDFCIKTDTRYLVTISDVYGNVVEKIYDLKPKYGNINIILQNEELEINSNQEFEIGASLNKNSSLILVTADDNQNIEGETLYNQFSGDKLTLKQNLVNKGQKLVEDLTYMIKAKDDDSGCMSLTKEIVVHVLKELNNEDVLNNSIVITPNPTTDQLTLNGAVDKIRSLEIYNAEGKRMIQIEKDQAIKNGISVAHLIHGNYFLFVNLNGKLEVIKFVKN